jgi:small subunit ribosomal protein S27e
MAKTNSSNFIKVKCAKCKNEQVIFNKPSTQVKCLVCGEELAKTSGGKAKIGSKPLNVY